MCSYWENNLRFNCLIIGWYKKKEMIFKITINSYNWKKNITKIIAKIQVLQKSLTYILKRIILNNMKLFWKPKSLLVIKTLYIDFTIK